MIQNKKNSRVRFCCFWCHALVKAKHYKMSLDERATMERIEWKKNSRGMVSQHKMCSRSEMLKPANQDKVWMKGRQRHKMEKQKVPLMIPALYFYAISFIFFRILVVVVLLCCANYLN